MIIPFPTHRIARSPMPTRSGPQGIRFSPSLPDRMRALTRACDQAASDAGAMADGLDQLAKAFGRGSAALARSVVLFRDAQAAMDSGDVDAMVAVRDVLQQEMRAYPVD